mmetsp:Transcript_25270/g.34810  ORF Transcript_25270/g.34810 Transcript_25270/m.34810 type:complete len:216 (-) Transcript_25270:110-757(-)|eukprot:CAMPEP_0196570474 /NCGR_PEP_ID=MMETSP1081-20130531/560_1 /TAXON_ID=36882 /ORGANISM="Pyramimonas amylifera, Strain CCMP720" /LENGTH=215 /DNA_ID=CAMNT_0041886929 /DNA_START=477 /DNA_END=1124 /DNA_ORIENTATION=+
MVTLSRPITSPSTSSHTAQRQLSAAKSYTHPFGIIRSRKQASQVYLTAYGKKTLQNYKILKNIQGQVSVAIEASASTSDLDLTFDPVLLKSNGYKLKKLQRMCKSHGLKTMGTADKLTTRLLNYYETRPGVFKPDTCFRFNSWLEHNSQARSVNSALADADFSIVQLEKMISDGSSEAEILEYLESELETILSEDPHFSFDENEFEALGKDIMFG